MGQVNRERQSAKGAQSLVSQEWEEIHGFINDGRGHFEMSFENRGDPQILLRNQRQWGRGVCSERAELLRHEHRQLRNQRRLHRPKLHGLLIQFFRRVMNAKMVNRHGHAANRAADIAQFFAAAANFIFLPARIGLQVIR